jgi:hypothetical protein
VEGEARVPTVGMQQTARYSRPTPHRALEGEDFPSCAPEAASGRVNEKRHFGFDSHPVMTHWRAGYSLLGSFHGTLGHTPVPTIQMFFSILQFPPTVPPTLINKTPD